MCSIDVDGTGTIHVASYSDFVSNLEYRTSTDGISWALESTVEYNSTSYLWSAIVVDGRNRAHIVYFDNEDDACYYKLIE